MIQDRLQSGETPPPLLCKPEVEHVQLLWAGAQQPGATVAAVCHQTATTTPNAGYFISVSEVAGRSGATPTRGNWKRVHEYHIYVLVWSNTGFFSAKLAR